MASPMPARRVLEPGQGERRGVEKRPAGFRLAERRWRNASFFLIERRKGKSWMYATIVLAAVLWAWAFLLFHR